MYRPGRHSKTAMSSEERISANWRFFSVFSYLPKTLMVVIMMALRGQITQSSTYMYLICTSVFPKFVDNTTVG